MDLDLEKIHNILIEANLPSSIKDLKNPTEEFVVKLINTFLKRFHIDFNTFDKVKIFIIYVILYIHSNIFIISYYLNKN